MDSFDCLVENDPNLSRLPEYLLRIIKRHYTKFLKQKVTEIINKRFKYNLFKDFREEIINFGGDYYYLRNLIHSGIVSIPESYGIIKCVLKRLWSELDMLPPPIAYMSMKIYTPDTPEWRIQLQERLHLKYKTDFVYCLSVLKCFVGYFKRGDLTKTFQFGYNLGRLQEITSKTDHTIKWYRLEYLFLEQEWSELDAYIDTIQKSFQIGYDHAILERID